MGNTQRKFLPVCEPVYLGNEEKYVMEAVQSKWISSKGYFVKEFEEQFSEYCNCKYGITTTSGTSALHLAMKAIGLQKGDEVILPTFTIASVLFAVLYCQAKPVFVDIDTDTWNISVDSIERKITSKTKAIVAVHTYGHPVEMATLGELAKKYELKIIEDAAEAHGAEYKGQKCGSIGTVGCFSFYANKIITTGEGGMLVTSDSEIADRCRYYKNLCFPTKGERDYFHQDVGYNYRMTNVQAALGVAQLENISTFIQRRRDNAYQYNNLLKEIPGIQLPAEQAYAKNVYWMYGIVIDSKKFGRSRDEVKDILKKAGVETRYFFRPLHEQEAWKNHDQYEASNDMYPNAQLVSENGLILPSGSGLEGKDITYICEIILEAKRSV